MNYSYEINNDKVIEHFTDANDTPICEEKIEWYIDIFEYQIEPFQSILSFYRTKKWLYQNHSELML